MEMQLWSKGNLINPDGIFRHKWANYTPIKPQKQSNCIDLQEAITASTSLGKQHPIMQYLHWLFRALVIITIRHRHSWYPMTCICRLRRTTEVNSTISIQTASMWIGQKLITRWHLIYYTFKTSQRGQYFHNLNYSEIPSAENLCVFKGFSAVPREEKTPERDEKWERENIQHLHYRQR